METVANDVEGAVMVSVAGSVVLPLSSSCLFWPLGDKKERRALCLGMVALTLARSRRCVQPAFTTVYGLAFPKL